MPAFGGIEQPSHILLDAYMNERQQLALQMLRENPTRDLYEGAAAHNTKVGSGLFFVTYSPNSTLSLTRGDINDLVSAGLIKLKWPHDPEVQFYVLTK